MTQLDRLDEFVIQCYVRESKLDSQYPMCLLTLADAKKFNITVHTANLMIKRFRDLMSVDDQLISLDHNDVSFALSYDGFAILAQIHMDRASYADSNKISEKSQDLLAGFQTCDNLLVLITASEDLLSSEFEQIARQIQHLSQPETRIKIGLNFDDGLKQLILLRIIATGLNQQVIDHHSI
jgi:cell division GTPase FtsZ